MIACLCRAGHPVCAGIGRIFNVHPGFDPSLAQFRLFNVDCDMKQLVVGVPIDVFAGSVPVQLPKEHVASVAAADGDSVPVLDTGKRDKKRRRQDEHAADMDPAELLEQRAQYRLQSRRSPLYAMHHLRTFGADGLIIVVDYHPLAILLQTIRLLKPGSPFAVFYHNLHELCECFQQLRHYGLASRLLLLEAWTRKYQVCDDAYFACGTVIPTLSASCRVRHSVAIYG